MEWVREFFPALPVEDWPVTLVRARARKDRHPVVVVRGEAAREIMVLYGRNPAPLVDHPETEYLDGWVSETKYEEEK